MAGDEAMPLNLKRRVPAAFGRETLWQNMTLIFCVLFGLALIANTQTAGDGGWFWYATFLHGGRRLYADMHLALQPLFVLETASFLALLGKGWLVSKAPAVLHVAAYCIGLLLVARSSKLPDRQKALVLACAFFVSIDFEAYRFDDYHVLADCFQVYSLVALLKLERTPVAWRSVGLAAALGVLCGLSLMTRLNDGAALFVGVAIAILCMAQSRRAIWLVLYSVAAGLTVLLVVRMTGDSLHDWAMYSILHAAGSKGGTGNVLAYPLRLPWNTMKFLRQRKNFEFAVYCLGAAAIWAGLIRPYRPSRRAAGLWKPGLGMVLILLPLHHFLGFLLDANVMVVLSAVGVLVAYGLGVAVFVRFLRWRFAVGPMQAWNRREILLLIPLGQLASGSMSSGAEHIGLYGPIGMLILLLPIASPIRLKSGTARAFALAIVAILAVHCATYKYRYPYIWHSYAANQMFAGRQWTMHPDYGPMIIEREELKFIEPICEAVKADGTAQGLLSLPEPYPNYFCSIEPWHGYVQTFFDTSSKETIEGLMEELQSAPPKWIVYQRQLNNLKLHEQIFNQGRPLPQRYLDQLIEEKIASGEWKPVYATPYGSRGYFTNEWILLRTRP
jgi:hypothetical protein